MLYCKICEVKVCAKKKFTVTQHLKINKHKRLLTRRNKSREKKSVYSHDLCKAMICANISLDTISNDNF